MSKLISAIRFNQEQTCFTCCMDDPDPEYGPQIFNIEPLKRIQTYSEMGTMVICEMLHRTNLLAMVSGGLSPKFSPNMVMVYDDTAKKFVIEINLKAPVKSVRLRRDILVASTVNRVSVFSFPLPKRLHTFETHYNPYGLCEISPTLSADFNFLVFPSWKKGSLQLIDLSAPHDKNRQKTIDAHVNELACLAMNQKGTMIATASEKGTLIRVFDTNKACSLHELRRGSKPARINCINFSPNSDFLCCTSDTGTVHIFALENPALNKQLTLPNVSPTLPGCSYTKSQWSFIKFTVQPECACVCSFRSQNSIIALCVDGSSYEYEFDCEGEIANTAFDMFLKDDIEDFEDDEDE